MDWVTLAGTACEGANPPSGDCVVPLASQQGRCGEGPRRLPLRELPGSSAWHGTLANEPGVVSSLLADMAQQQVLSEMGRSSLSWAQPSLKAAVGVAPAAASPDIAAASLQGDPLPPPPDALRSVILKEAVLLTASSQPSRTFYVSADTTLVIQLVAAASFSSSSSGWTPESADLDVAVFSGSGSHTLLPPSLTARIWPLGTDLRFPSLAVYTGQTRVPAGECSIQLAASAVSGDKPWPLQLIVSAAEEGLQPELLLLASQQMAHPGDVLDFTALVEPEYPWAENAVLRLTATSFNELGESVFVRSAVMQEQSSGSGRFTASLPLPSHSAAPWPSSVDFSASVLVELVAENAAQPAGGEPETRFTLSADLTLPVSLGSARLLDVQTVLSPAPLPSFVVNVGGVGGSRRAITVQAELEDGYTSASIGVATAAVTVAPGDTSAALTVAFSREQILAAASYGPDCLTGRGFFLRRLELFESDVADPDQPLLLADVMVSSISRIAGSFTVVVCHVRCPPFARARL